MTAAKAGCGRKPHDFAQPAPHAVAFDGAADLPRYCEADPDRTTIASIECLQHKCRRRHLGPATGGGQKVGALPQTLHGGRPPGSTSGAEATAAMGTALGEHPAAALGRHARPEAMTALAHQLARLVGPL